MAATQKVIMQAKYLIALLLSIGIAVDAQGGTSVAAEPRFVGFSNASVQGDAGLAGMHGACAETFGAGARMCLEIEVFKTPDLQPIPSVPSGWIQPYQNQSLGVDTCESWSSIGNGLNGTVLSGERMQFAGMYYITYPEGWRTETLASCSDLRPVACCQ